MHIVDHAGLDADGMTALREVARRLLTLEEVVRWGLALSPLRMIASVVVQDEYTHDVVMAWTEGRWLVFDTT